MIAAVSLAEQYRPRSWGEVVGQPKAVSMIAALAKARGGE